MSYNNNNPSQDQEVLCCISKQSQAEYFELPHFNFGETAGEGVSAINVGISGGEIRGDYGSLGAFGSRGHAVAISMQIICSMKGDVKRKYFHDDGDFSGVPPL